MKKIKVGSDFSGVGAFDQALKNLNINYENVFACDMDKYARITYLANNEMPNYYPHDVYERDIPSEPLDIYMSSPPCQSFSLAGNRLGEDDERGVLFYNTHEFIKKNKPRYFIIENVKGLLSDNKGRTFGRWQEYLGGKSINGNPVIFPCENSVPYHIYWKVVNARNHGVPQNRERVFIVGIRDDEDNRFQWAKEIPLVKRLRDVLEDEVDEKYFLSKAQIDSIIHAKYESKGIDRVNHIDSYCNALTAMSGGNRAPKIHVKSNTKKGYESAEVGNDSINLAFPKSLTRRGRVGKNVAQTLDTSCNQGVISDNMQIRRLTPRECFRSMDFPDTFDISQVSDSQAYKQAGNSIVVKCLELIIQQFTLQWSKKI